MRILIVDDNAQNRYFLERLLAAHGHQCLSVTDGRAALLALKADKFDAIVSDVLMPGMDGFQLCRETRRDEAIRETPFVFYTATYTDAADREFGLSLGASAYVVKPSSPEEILSAIAGVRNELSSAPTSELVDSDAEFYQVYNPRLVRKLEQKVLELEEAQRAMARSNEALRDEIKRRSSAESALSDSLALFEATIACTADGIFACGVDGRVVALNSQFKAAWRLGVECALQTFAQAKLQLRARLLETGTFDRIMVPGDHANVDSAVLTLLDGGELELRRRPLVVAGQVVGQVWSCTNTTERRHAEKRELELQRRLWDAQKLTDLGLLAAGIAHDFNNLLAVVRASADAARSVLAPEHPVQEMLEDVIVCSDAGATLVNQILEFSRREKLRSEPQSLAKLVKDSMRLLKLLAPRALEIHLQLQDTRSKVVVHPAQLTQILLNLAVNAVQAMRGRGRMTIGVGPVSERAKSKASERPGEFVELIVVDDGAGMEPAVATRMFEPFFTTKAPGQGTGIGLTTVHQIVAELGGWIVVESEPGQGTTFRVVLPVAVDSIGPLRAPEAKLSRAGERGDSSTPKRRVLAIEPDVGEREKLRACLEEMGYEAHVFAEGPAALERMAGRELADIAVVGQFGSAEAACELGRVLRALRSDLPLVFTSFSDYSSFVSTSSNSSGCAVLSRPYRVDTIGELFRALTRDV